MLNKDRSLSEETQIKFDGEAGIMFYNFQEKMLVQMLFNYIDGSMSLRKIQEFSLANVQAFLNSKDPLIVELVKELEGSVVEVDEGLMSEDELKKSLVPILNKYSPADSVWTSCLEPLYERSTEITPLQKTVTFNFAFA